MRSIVISPDCNFNPRMIENCIRNGFIRNLKIIISQIDLFFIVLCYVCVCVCVCGVGMWYSCRVEWFPCDTNTVRLLLSLAQNFNFVFMRISWDSTNTMVAPTDNGCCCCFTRISNRAHHIFITYSIITMLCQNINSSARDINTAPWLSITVSTDD